LEGEIVRLKFLEELLLKLSHSVELATLTSFMHALEEHARSIEGLHNLNELLGLCQSPESCINLLCAHQHLMIYIYNLPEHITILFLLIIYSLAKPCHLFFD